MNKTLRMIAKCARHQIVDQREVSTEYAIGWTRQMWVDTGETSRTRLTLLMLKIPLPDDQILNQIAFREGLR